MTGRIRWWVAIAALGLAMWSGLAAAQPAGEVEYARGAGIAQSPGEPPRVLGKGLALQQSDRLTTSAGGLAIVRLIDGTRMTLRPNSELVLREVRLQPQGPGSALVMDLLRGGIRAKSGSISKQSPDAVKIHTAVATLGVRGTEFEARLCAQDCAEDARKRGAQPRPSAVQASARVVAFVGEVVAIDAHGQRRLSEGGSLYPGDTVVTSAGSHAVLSFRDRSRMTLGPDTRLRIDDFVFDDSNAREGRFLVSLLRGTTRALTGLIAQANPRNVQVSTPTATIGVRGTGLDVSCTGACAGEPATADGAGGSMQACTWRGAIVVRPSGQEGGREVAVDECAQVTQGQAVAAPALQLATPRPDGVPVPDNLFTQESLPEGQPGLYVVVREGDVVMDGPGGTLHLGRGETGYTDGTRTLRPSQDPLVPTLPPDLTNPTVWDVLNESGLPFQTMCR